MRLNSTGSLSRELDGTIVSYRTPIYREFTLKNGKVLKVFNDTYYSATTRKHQANIREYEKQSDVVFHNCPYGDWSLVEAFQNEIYTTKYDIRLLENKKRKLGKRQAEQLKNLKTRLEVLQNLFAEV